MEENNASPTMRDPQSVPRGCHRADHFSYVTDLGIFAETNFCGQRFVMKVNIETVLSITFGKQKTLIAIFFFNQKCSILFILSLKSGVKTSLNFQSQIHNFSKIYIIHIIYICIQKHLYVYICIHTYIHTYICIQKGFCA